MATPEFILSLRARIGNDELWLPGVTVLVTDDQGRILLGQRVDTERWALPSGIPEPGEEMAVTAYREVLEETGVEIEVEQLISISSEGPITYPNGDRTRYVDHFFRAHPVGGEAKVNDDESLAVGWYRPEDLPEPFSPRARALLLRAAENPDRTWFARP